MTPEPGILYILATPLGNLDDLTLRACRVLREADLVAAEDTRRTRKLLTHLGITPRIISYREQNHKTAYPQILNALAGGKSVVLVSDAGTPGVSDPGAWVVREIAARGYKITPIPGPSAVATALSVTGFPADSYLFVGFLPSKKAERRQALEALKTRDQTLAIFETPHRILDSLADILNIMGDRPAVLCREMTKKNEEFLRGRISELLEILKERGDRVRGEITLVVTGAQPAMEKKLTREELVLLIKDDPRPVRELVAELSGATELNRSDLYRLALELTGRRG